VTDPAPPVGVVVPYYDDQPRLTLLLRALAQQRTTVPFEIVVADDGSPARPVIPPGLGRPVTVVSQPDQGFRAAAARNLGAAHTAADLLLFLDGDTLPTPGYVQAMVDRLCALDDGSGALVVGRRRHADLGSVPADEVLRFLCGDTVSGITVLDEPSWLRDGYARTDDLGRAGEEDFRLIISAVLGVDRRLWSAIGGFDASFVGYGGEDWDLGWRAWLSGARWAHEPAALAWHDGPDAAGRAASSAPSAVNTDKNTEALRLARTIPLPSVRGRALVLAQPDIVVRYLGPTTGTAADAAVVAGVVDLLAGVDAGVWFPRCSADGPDRLPPLLAEDPRVRAGQVPADVLRRARFQVSVTRPLTLSAPLDRCCAAGEWEVPGWVSIRRTRSLNRGEPPPPGRPIAPPGPDPLVRPIPDDVSLERWWGGW
jgi:GT2 family glycosyltransferase